MKILMPGFFWRGSRGLSYKNAFEKNGCEVVPFDLDKFFPSGRNKGSNGFFSKIFSRMIRMKNIRRFNAEFVSFAIKLNPDLIFVLKGSEISPKSLAEIKRWCTSLIFQLNPDDFFPPRYPANKWKWVIESIPLYDCVFTHKTYSLRRELMEKGANRVEYLPFGYDGEINKPAKLSDEEKKSYEADIVFIGSPEKERNLILEKIADAGYDLKIYGNEWEKVPGSENFKKCFVKKPVYGEEMAKVYAGAKIVIAFMRRGDRDLSNPRMFEVPACGAFMAVERTREVLRFFEENKEVVCFENFEELKPKLDFYLSREEERKKISTAALEKMRKENWTYEGRAKRVLEVFDSLEREETIVK